MGSRADGYWQMPCWNGLTPDQQERLLLEGTLGWGWEPEGSCPHGAELEVTTQWDVAPGPRFYCLDCAVKYLASLQEVH